MATDFVRPAKAGRFLLSTKTSVLDSQGVSRAVARIAHEILERNRGANELVIVGIESGGTWMAELLAERISDYEGVAMTSFPLDVSRHRDDRREGSAPGSLGLGPAEHDVLEGKTIILVDDVLYTGRTVRAALDAIVEFGRPAAVQLAVLVDRGHRELPVHADYVGKNLPTSRAEIVIASSDGIDIGVIADED